MEAIIRTSDRGRFKRCRTLWDFQSPLRKGYRYVGTKQSLPLIFGSAMHYAFSYFYNKDYWETSLKEAEIFVLGAFDIYLKEVEEQVLLDKDQIEELRILGYGVLGHFFKEYAPQDRAKWEPIYSELEFEVELDLDRLNLANSDISKVLYQGAIDFVGLEKNTGLLWEWDHKTSAKRKENHKWLFLDTQFTTYIWGLRSLGIDVAGIIYNEVYKGFPQPPKVNKNGSLSKNKQQDTTYKIFVETLREHKLKAEPYLEYLDHLSNTEIPYINRIEIQKTPKEIITEENNIYNEVREMLNDPAIYPTVGEFGCNNCEFYEPCLAKLRGNDQWFLDSKFYIRMDDA